MTYRHTSKIYTVYLFININQLDALNFIISLFQASTCFEHMCSSSGGQKLYYTVSGIITPVGGRPVHRLREDWLILRNKYIEMHGQQNIKKKKNTPFTFVQASCCVMNFMLPAYRQNFAKVAPITRKVKQTCPKRCYRHRTIADTPCGNITKEPQ